MRHGIPRLVQQSWSFLGKLKDLQQVFAAFTKGYRRFKTSKDSYRFHRLVTPASFCF